MTDRECVVRRSISRTKAWSAERRLHNRSGFDQISDCSIFHQFHINRCTCRIYAECKFVRADIFALDNVCCRADIFKSTAGTSRNQSLIHIELAVHNLALQRIIYCAIQTYQCLLLYFMKNIFQIRINFIDCVYIGRMERHCNHRFDLTQIHIHHTVIVRHCSRIQFFIITLTSVNLIELADLLIRLPDRRQAGGLCGHNIDTDTEICTQLIHTGTDKFHNLIIHISITKCRTDNCQCYILRTDTLPRLAVQIDCNDLRHADIVSLIQQLLYKLRSALAHCHSTQRTITSVAVRTKNHLAATCQHLSGKLMDNSLMRRYIHAAIFLCTCQSKHVIIFINRTANCTQ